MNKTTEQKCGKCAGTGKLQKVNGDWLRWRRQAADLSLRALAKKMGFTAGFLCDVELGRRNCTEKVLKAYEGL